MKILLLITVVVVSLVSPAFSQGSDAALRRAIDEDAAARANGKLPLIPAPDHLSRADVYMANRMFPQAREHWQAILENYPQDPGMSRALFGHGRSYMWEREYSKAVEWFDRLLKEFPFTKDGREGLAFKGASLVRLGKNVDAAKTYEQYTVMFPAGEKIESAHLNIIDAYREAGRYDDANLWVNKTVSKFVGKPTAVNALQARVRMEIYRENWNAAIAAADSLLAVSSFARSMTSSDEAKYLKALALERSGRRPDANAVYSSIGASQTSYYGGLAQEKLSRPSSTASEALVREYPVMFRTEVLKQARKHKVDPRFMLAIMKQESSFRTNAKSPAGARGLLQFVFDTAIKYNKKAGYTDLHPDDLYRPEVNIALGAVYIGELKDEFDGLYEAIAASYNGGEDNAARWLNRSRPKEPGIFAAEVGFAETKSYVFKVMNNYRIYRQLYSEDLQRK